MGPSAAQHARSEIEGIAVHASGANQNYLHQSTVALWRMQSDQREHGQLRRYME